MNGLDEDICLRLHAAIPDYELVVNFRTHMNVSDHDIVKHKLVYKDDMNFTISLF